MKPEVYRCHHCRTQLAAGRRGRKYCSPNCRFKAWRKRQGVSESACTYCGVMADTIDHVPAKAVRPHLREHAPGVYPEVEVVCCRECNCALGARGFTLAARRELARDAIERRYRSVLAMPHWTEEEIAAMGPGMRSVINHDQVLKGWVLDRLRWTR